MGIVLKTKGSFDKTERFLLKLGRFGKNKIINKLKHYGEMGVAALSSNTPYDTGKTAESWDYEIIEEDGRARLIFTNSNVVNGWCSVAIILQYGHVGRNGVWIEGIDYINPVIRPIFEKCADDIWQEVRS